MWATLGALAASGALAAYGASSSKEDTKKYEHYDPYEYWNKQFGGQYNTGIQALIEELRTSADPTHSGAFRSGQAAIEEASRTNRNSIMTSLIGRGGAFGGQARRASADIAGGKARALADLIARLKMNRPQIAQMLSQLSGSMFQPPGILETGATSTFNPSFMDSLEKSLGLVGNVAGMLGAPIGKK
jgi:hypothetical protein